MRPRSRWGARRRRRVDAEGRPACRRRSSRRRPPARLSGPATTSLGLRRSFRRMGAMEWGSMLGGLVTHLTTARVARLSPSVCDVHHHPRGRSGQHERPERQPGSNSQTEHRVRAVGAGVGHLAECPVARDVDQLARVPVPERVAVLACMPASGSGSPAGHRRGAEPRDRVRPHRAGIRRRSRPRSCAPGPRTGPGSRCPGSLPDARDVDHEAVEAGVPARSGVGDPSTGNVVQALRGGAPVDRAGGRVPGGFGSGSIRGRARDQRSEAEGDDRDGGGGTSG